MSLDPTPLFRPDVLARRVEGFTLPESAHEGRDHLDRWTELFRSNRGQEYKESELRADFLTHVFVDILGYTGPVTDEREEYTLSREQLVEVDGKFADAVLGEFTTEKEQFQPVVAVEAKGPQDPLQRAFGGRALSAVDQAYRYAINLPCDWVVVTNLQEIRLYHKGSTQRSYQRYRIERLAKDDAEFRQFLYVLGADRVVPDSGRCHLYDLLEVTEKADEKVTQEFYEEYADMRRKLLDALREHNAFLQPKDAISAAQKLLDRVLFIAFCEDRGLLPEETLKRAYEKTNPYNPQPTWDNFLGLFRAVDQGRDELNIPQYNGGLFAEDPVLHKVDVPDEVCGFFKRLGEYDYRSAAAVGNGERQAGDGALIDVEILGHIFEQSITDLEALHTELTAENGGDAERTRRQREGAFYTPEYITEHIVSEALQPVLEERFESLREEHQGRATGTAISALENPRVYDLEELNNPQTDALIEFWKAWLDELKTIRVVDPACGSGAFLIEVFDQLYPEYQQMTERLDELRESRSRDHQLSLQLDPNRTILRNNLYGVDLNEEAVQICRLSIWIKTAERGKELTNLDENIRVGNSIVSDPGQSPDALDWQEAFPKVFEDGGFDVVVGNPPYVRAEELKKDVKSYLEETYATFHGDADLYVYFFEKGLDLLRPDGRLSYVVTNKWFKVRYGAPLRRMLAEETMVEAVLDLGHAREVFPDADVFPSIVVVRNTRDGPTEEETSRVCVIPRDQLEVRDLEQQIREFGFVVSVERFGAGEWSLEHPDLHDLLEKISEAGPSLVDYVGEKPASGIKTGLNRAFVVDERERQSILETDPGADELMHRFVRGRHTDRWALEYKKEWVLLLKSSTNTDWPWSGADSEEEARRLFRETYPGVHEHLSAYEERARDRYDQGEWWWELRSCDYYDVFEQPKIMWPDIAFHPTFCLDSQEAIPRTTCFAVPTDDPWLLACLNSPLMWAWLWRNTAHGKDEALRLKTVHTQNIPVAIPSGSVREHVTANVGRLRSIVRHRHQARDQILEWLAVEFDIRKPGNRLENPHRLDADGFVRQVRDRQNRKKRLTSSDVSVLREEFAEVVGPVRKALPEARRLERAIADAVNGAYGLSDREVDLLWRTAPPRMPIEDPRQASKVVDSEETPAA